jgi:aryl-alcohol dehydrogenase-like predicted oxidoreductase
MMVSPSGTFALGGDLLVNRLGYGAMQLAGPGVWGRPRDWTEATHVLRRAVELGVNFIDTAEAYGPFLNEELIAEALHPYPPGLVIATKTGLDRPGPAQWTANATPSRIRQACEGSLRRLRLQRIDLYQLHRINPDVPLEDQLRTFADLQREGKVRHIGLSEVTVAELEQARRQVTIVSVQNRYNVAERRSEPVLDVCERDGIGFIPWYPLSTGKLAGKSGPLAAPARRLGATPAQVALAWLLRRTPVMLPIPGTSSVAHVEENIAAASLELTDEEFERISQAATK